MNAITEWHKGGAAVISVYLITEGGACNSVGPTTTPRSAASLALNIANSLPQVIGLRLIWMYFPHKTSKCKPRLGLRPRSLPPGTGHGANSCRESVRNRKKLYPTNV